MQHINKEREEIIEQLRQVKDINVLNSIRNLLNFVATKEKMFDAIVLKDQKESVRKRVADYKENPENVMTWVEIEKKINII